MPGARRRDVILLYHAIGPRPAVGDPRSLFVGADAFERQLIHVAARAEIVPLASMLEPASSGSRPRAAITFDDGFRNVLSDGVPILRRLGLPATIFVPTALLRTAAPTGRRTDRLSAEELAGLERADFEIGSHGHEHLDLGKASADEVRDDLEASRKVLAGVLGRPPRYLAWPFGSSSEQAREAAEAVGFEAAFATERWPCGRFAYERIGVYPGDGRITFALKASGWYGAMRRSPLGTLAAQARSLTRRRGVA